MSITILASVSQDPARQAADCSALCGQRGCSEARGGICVLLTTATTDWPEKTEDALEKPVQCQQIKQNPIQVLLCGEYKYRNISVCTPERYALNEHRLESYFQSPDSCKVKIIAKSELKVIDIKCVTKEISPTTQLNESEG